MRCEQTVTEGELQIAYNHEEKCLASFKIREMQGKLH